ncbi:nucleotide exchange factor GrpE [Candidatus Nanohalococcus occultus]|uniref:Protein GrpE n=1 Tax=Candidatus Nanohalococcus occultus TaxID=2978047 RepID=A0ABY8CGB4_9ARCH|nr:Molecular chaperone GrpE (heat shock protein) [Candidatus Nanohaloarchaeota archaeon SVXNc]
MSYEELSREQLEEALEQLEKQAKELEESRDEWETKAKKFKADFENYKSKQDERKDRWQEKAEEDLAEDLLEVIDNLEMAIQSADEDSAVVKGVEMVADQIHDKLNKRGLEKIEAKGEEFDPNHHKAVETREHEEHNLVLEEKRNGYYFGEKVLRPSEVVVGKKEEE